jgi:hypothetical protein
MMHDVFGATRAGPWIYRLSQNEHSSWLRDRLQWVRDLHRKGRSVVVATSDGRAPRTIMSDVPVISWSQSEEKQRPVAGFIAGNQEDFPRGVQADTPLILHDLAPHHREWTCDAAMVRVGREQSGYSISRRFLVPAHIKNTDGLAVQYHGHVNAALRCLQEQMPWPIHLMPPDPHELEWATAIQSSGWCVILSDMVSDRVYLEAMAAGCVVVGLPKGASSIIRHGVNAWLVEAEQISASLSWLRKPDQRDLVGAITSAGLATAWSFAEEIP